MRKGDDISKRKEGSFAHTSKDRTFRTILARLYAFIILGVLYFTIAKMGGRGSKVEIKFVPIKSQLY